MEYGKTEKLDLDGISIIFTDYQNEREFMTAFIDCFCDEGEELTHELIDDLCKCSMWNRTDLYSARSEGARFNRKQNSVVYPIQFI